MIQNIHVKPYISMSSESQQVRQSNACDKKPSSIPALHRGPPHPTDKKGTPTITVPYSYFLEKDLACQKKLFQRLPWQTLMY
jgi:hypothetical protein